MNTALVQCSSDITRKNVQLEINTCRKRLRILKKIIHNKKALEIIASENYKPYSKLEKPCATKHKQFRSKNPRTSVMNEHVKAKNKESDMFNTLNKPVIRPEDRVIICTNDQVAGDPPSIRIYQRPERWSKNALNSGTVNTVLISVGPSESGVQTKVNIQLVDPARISDVSDRTHSLRRALSYQEDLNTVGRLSRCASYGDAINLAGGVKEQTPSVEDILESIRKMSKEKTRKGKPQQGSLLGIKYNNPKSEPLYCSTDISPSPKLSDGIYQNIQEGLYENMEDWYDSPKSPTSTYVNLTTHIESEYENIKYEERVYSNSVETKKSTPMYDTPKPAIHIYDRPLPKKDLKYDKPRNNEGSESDLASLEYEAEDFEDLLIPPPDYLNVKEEHYDEGIGESDSRSYYTEDQGLEVIPEETEEEEEEEDRHSSTKQPRNDYGIMSSCDTTKDVVRTASSNTSLGSLGGSESEGIGSAAEGEFHSSGESTHGEDIEQRNEINKDLLSNSQEKEDSQTEEKTEADRCIEVYNETVRQRSSSRSPRVSVCESAKDYAGTETLRRMKKFLPSVRNLRNQFEVKKNEQSDDSPGLNYSPCTKTRSRRSSVESNLSTSSMSSKSSSSSTNVQTNEESRPSSSSKEDQKSVPSIESIIKQFANLDIERFESKTINSSWNPTSLVNLLYTLPTPPPPAKTTTAYVNIEGYLEKLPSGRKKATFWNAWKKRYFRLENGYLYYYQSNQNEKPSLKIQLMGGEIQLGEGNMIGIDDGKGHYIATRCRSEEETEKWMNALQTQIQENFNSAWVHPSPTPMTPTLYRDTLILDVGSCSIRAGILANQTTLPQLFIPSIVAKNKFNEIVAYGYEALKPNVRMSSFLKYPFRTSSGVDKYSLDMAPLSGFLSLIFQKLNVDPSRYYVQLSLPRSIPPSSQAEMLKIMFEEFGVRGVNLSNQSVLALSAYRANSGIVVDIGERIEIVPIMDGYMLNSGTSRVPYGGCEIIEHLRQFLLQKNYSLVSEVETYFVRLALERLCYVSGPSPEAYHTDLQLSHKDPLAVSASLSLEQFDAESIPWRELILDSGRFQVPEGLFHPEAWGLDHPGVQKLVSRAIQECGVDIRKEMSRSIFLAGGVTMLPGFAERLEEEVNRLTPSGITPKVHASPYRYHAAYLGASEFASSPAFDQQRINLEDWKSIGPNVIRKWKT
ncbi:hypothetical protein QYM36_005533 [Artemia franciscana]|uniref:PH domain-containing protein n=1 Tax=Artemia franciscana TaxID=6661 RepID=A0AA88L608_ARTSF|nr:hypothetical protein QYM36_005533 [Artemia franciscana]